MVASSVPLLGRSTHEEWKLLIHNCSISTGDLLYSAANTRQGTQCSISQEEASMEVNHEDIYTTLYTRVQVAAQPEHDPVPAPRPWAVDTWYYVEHVSSSSQQLPVSLVAEAVVVLAVVLC